MRLREQWNYILHIGSLVRNSPEDLRFLLFCSVGILGVFINMLSLIILMKIFECQAVTASVSASLIALIHNYYLNKRITWRDCNNPVIWRRVLQFPQFIAVCSLGIAITMFLVQGFVTFGWNIYIGQLLGIVIATVWSYSANNRWTWSRIERDTNLHSKMKVTQEYPHELS